MKFKALLKTGVVFGVIALMSASGLLAACAGQAAPATPAQTQDTAQAEETEEPEDEAGADAAAADSGTASTSTQGAVLDPADRVPMRVGALKGPTTIGLLHLMHDVGYHVAAGNFLYEFTVETDPAAISAKMIGGELDVALVPANLASVLYNRTQGGIVVLNINTLGVLECVSADESIAHITDLSGKTVLSTGQGATPEYALRYLLDQYGVADCTIEFHAEATEIAALMQERDDIIAVLPQPFATVASAQNEAYDIRFALTDEWDALNNNSTLITGVTVARREYLESLAEPVSIDYFLDDHTWSMIGALTDPEGTAPLIVEAEIIGNENVAKAALPRCGIAIEELTDTQLPGYAPYQGERMKELLSGYLQTLFDADPASVGGALPGDDFYYLGTE